MPCSTAAMAFATASSQSLWVWIPRMPSKVIRANLGNLVGHGPAIRIAQRDGVGAGFVRGLQSAKGEVAAVFVAVEKMFGVVDHFFAVRLEVAHGIRDQLQVFFF